MDFIRINLSNIEEYKYHLSSFFKNNEKYYNFFHPHEFSYKGFFQEISSKEKDYYVFIIENNVLIGYGMLRGWDEGFDIPSLGIMIDKNSQGKGLSIKMMDHLHKVSKERGSDKVRLTVYKENKPAISLYNRLGYSFSGKNENELIGIKKI